MVHPKRCDDAVRKWTEDPSRMSPQDARILSKASGYLVTVTQMLPQVYGGLTVHELGYSPADFSAKQKP